ncbi:MAG: Trk system potassium transporter TrkA [Bacteroidaceae bacterium]|nr:Trk system potassium transporter TrkA [Bacteroidaceae bacterium]
MNIIIAGAHDIGTHLAQLLSRLNHEVKLIDQEEERLSRFGELDLLTYCGHPSSMKTLKAVEIEDADLFVAVTLDENTNLNACYMAKYMGAKKCVAKVNSSEYADSEHQAMFKHMGVDSVIYPERLAGKQIASGLKQSWVRQRVDFEDSDLVLLGIKLREEAKILDIPFKDLSDSTTPYHIVAIRRGGETIIPGGADSLKLLDMAYFMTTKQYIPYIRKIVGKENYVDIKKVMFVGAGGTGFCALQELPSYLDVKVFEKRKKRCETVNNALDNSHIIMFESDGRDLSTLKDEGIASAHAFVACTGDAETNILACLTAKKFGVRKTVAVIDNMDYTEMAVSLDIGTIVNKKALAASNIYQNLLDHGEVLDIRYLTTADADIVEFIAKEGSKVTKKTVQNLGLPKGCTIGGLVRNGESKLVSGGTQIMADDRVIVFCHNIRMEKVETWFN